MKKLTFIAWIVLFSGYSGQGQIAAWNFYGQTAPITFPATTFHMNLVTSNGASNITRGAGAPASGGIHSFRTTGFQNNGISTTNTDYFQITLQAIPGYKLSLSTLDAKFNGTATFFANPGVTSQFAYSLNGVDFILIGSPVQSTSLTMAQIDLTGIPDLQNVYSVTTVTLRYYASGQTTTGGWGFYSGSSGTNGLAVGGSVTEALIPAPTLQASGITFSNVQQTRMTVSWTPGNGEKRVVKINTLNNFTDPPDGTDPVADPFYAGMGEQVVYNYSGSTIPEVSGLTSGITYWFRVYEYNGAGTLTMFNTNTGMNNPASQTASTILLAPSICSPTATLITPVSALLGGHITSDGGSEVTVRGTVWSTSSPVTFNDHNLTENFTDTGFFAQPRDSLPPGTQIHYAAYAGNAIGTTLTTEAAFFTLTTEPSGHVSEFTASSAGTTAIDLAWIPLLSDTDGYLILQKQGTEISAGTPSDASGYSPGTMIGDGIVAANITTGTTGMTTITGLSPGTSYAFSIFPYTWNGTNPQTTNYFTQSPVPGAVATTAVPAVATYHWTGATGNDWNVPGNWSPSRSVPALNDILVFDTGDAWSITNVPAQTIGQVHVLLYTEVTLSGAGTLTVAGDTGEDLLVDAGCQLNISGPGAISISLAAGSTGLVNGTMIFSGGGHRLLAASTNGITFGPGSLFRAGSGFSGNPFGNTNLNSVVFNAGSVYACQAGGNPFGATAPASVTVFQPGSLYRIEAYTVPSFGGRTYGNFEMNYAGAITATGSSAVSIDNFTASQGTFYFNTTGSPGHSIKGNIFVANVATLIFAPSAAGKVLLNGTYPQTISGNGSVMAGPNSTLAIGNISGVTLNMNATLNNVTINPGGLFTIGPHAELTVNGDLVNEVAASGLILEPDGSMIHHNTGVPGTVKRNFASASWFDRQDGWHFLSSPVADQPIDTTGGFITAGAGNDFDFFVWSEPDDLWVNFKNTTIPPYFSDINGSSNFETGTGYLAAYEQAENKVFSGVLNVDDVPVENLTTTGTNPAIRGWHLLGNPFPCALSWYNGWSTVNIGGVAQIWNEEGRSYTPCNAGEAIPACNGFMVQVIGSPGNSGSLTIPAANRIHDSQPWYKESEDPVLKLLVRNIGLSSFQESQIRFNPLSTKNFDPEFDGRFLPGYAPHFYSVCGEEKLAVNSFPALANDISIPFSFEKDVGTHFQIEAQFMGELPAIVLLADRKTGINHNLTLDPVYRFTTDEDDLPERFEVTFIHVGMGELPVKRTKVSSFGNKILINHHGNIRLEVFGISGKSILLQEMPGTGSEMVILDAPSGWYLVRVTKGKEVEITKVIIQSSL